MTRSPPAPWTLPTSVRAAPEWRERSMGHPGRRGYQVSGRRQRVVFDVRIHRNLISKRRVRIVLSRTIRSNRCERRFAKRDSGTRCQPCSRPQPYGSVVGTGASRRRSINVRRGLTPRTVDPERSSGLLPSPSKRSEPKYLVLLGTINESTRTFSATFAPPPPPGANFERGRGAAPARPDRSYCKFGLGCRVRLRPSHGRVIANTGPDSGSCPLSF
jgi:hypothetical protein